MKKVTTILLLVQGLFFCGCGPAVGQECRDDYDCPRDGFCCESSRCGGGMCTFSCDNDRDCPGGTGCEGGICMELCDTSRQCRYDMHCTRSGVCSN